MNAKIVTFTSQGDKTLLEYDPATTDMATGERLEKVTREQNEVLMVHPIAGG